jgi:hypothetical protein
MEKIMTAEEFLKEFELNKPYLESLTNDNRGGFYSSAQGAMVTIDVIIEFAKYHVKNALEAATKNANTINEGDYGSDGPIDHYVIDKDSILNAYPPSNII